MDALSRAYSSRAAERAGIGDLIGRPRNCVAALGDDARNDDAGDARHAQARGVRLDMVKDGHVTRIP